MTSIFKMEFFKMMKSKFTWVILLMVVLGNFIGPLMSSNQDIGGNTPGFSIVEKVEGGPSQETTNQEKLIQGLKGNTVLIAAVVFTILFISLYHSSDYEKNISTVLRQVDKMIFVDLVMISLFVVILVLLSIASTLAGYVIAGLDISLVLTHHFVIYLATYATMLAISSQGFALFMMLMGKRTLALVFSLLYTSGIPFGIVNRLTDILLKQELVVENYLPSGLTFGLKLTEDLAYYGQTLLLGSGWLLLFLLAQRIYLSKRDII